jgi:heat shock protein HslJ
VSFRSLVGFLVLALGLPCALTANASELADTSWRLVKIMSMDDSVYEPDDRSKYTLDLRADGRAALQADCNRGMGSWTSESASHLTFGPIAATRALCPPGSLSDKYLAQFEWVRSYVMQDGHLFLATMADGAIIEFEPAGAEPLAATVLGEELRTADAAEMETVILTRLFGQFAAERGIAAEPWEIDAFLEEMERGMAAQGLTADDDLTPEEVGEVEALRRDMARTMIRQWKINKALYDRYGGRIIYQQLGPEPLDAYRLFLEERQREGAFTIHDQALAKRFWRYFTDESIHDFMEPGGADEARAFAVPPWRSRPEN